MRGGFTLLEVLVSISIVAIIMTLAQATTKQILDAKERIEARDQIFREGRVALRRLADDLTSAYLIRRPSAAAAAAEGEPSLLPPVTTTTLPATFFIGEDRGEQDSLRLTTLSHVRRTKNARESDQTRVKYELRTNPDDPRRFDLMRVEVPWLDEKTEVEGKGYAIAEGVVAFDVEYYDVRQDEWVKEWDTEKVDWAQKLPVAVRVRLAFADPDGGDEPIDMTTAAMPALSAGPI